MKLLKRKKYWQGFTIYQRDTRDWLRGERPHQTTERFRGIGHQLTTGGVEMQMSADQITTRDQRSISFVVDDASVKRMLLWCCWCWGDSEIDRLRRSDITVQCVLLLTSTTSQICMI
ncbi:hypothetical protein C0Q70_14054 [Pomacea canaliculata]|uniref:Uncharacterized protein n=1 Tax=Pomacea canaliculata TaxID=400727 RepID=A0A2T7NYX5_POMCA|nr:hypothetical protein C0Q70_14054 [Pomacea canaliculata]